MANRIKEFRDKLDLTQQQLADLVGTSNQQIGHLESGKRRLTADWMVRISKALDCAPADLMVEPSGVDVTFVRGAVQAGRWLEANEWDRGDWYSVFVPVPEEWRRMPKFGLEVRGNSMNRRYAEGSVVICVRLVDADLEPVPGHRYIVQRVDPGGLHEVTVKELRLDRSGRPWLWPDSDDPEHQEPIALDGKDGDEVEILAVVVASVQPE